MGLPIDYGILPADLQEGMRSYVEDRRPPGGFLRAVLENRLAQSWRRADLANHRRMGDIVEFLHELPPPCWGSEKFVEDWLAGEEK